MSNLSPLVCGKKEKKRRRESVQCPPLRYPGVSSDRPRKRLEKMLPAGKVRAENNEEEKLNKETC